MKVHLGECRYQERGRAIAANAGISVYQMLDEMEVIIREIRMKCEWQQRLTGEESAVSQAVVDLMLTIAEPQLRINWVREADEKV